MEVILLENIGNLGVLGDKVDVKPGYGRNFLIPQGKAVPATVDNVAKFEARRAELEAAAAETLSAAQARADALAALDGYGPTSIRNLLAAIEARRTIGLARFIFALGIRQVGQATARLLAFHYGSADALLAALNPDADLAAAHAALVEIDQIGDAMADDITGFFSSPAHFDMITALTAALTILPPERPADDSLLSGKILVFTGTLEKMSRAEAKARAESLGAKVSGSVSAKTDYLVAGTDAGSKARKAAELGIAILTEADWLTLAGIDIN